MSSSSRGDNTFFARIARARQQFFASPPSTEPYYRVLPVVPEIELGEFTRPFEGDVGLDSLRQQLQQQQQQQQEQQSPNNGLLQSRLEATESALATVRQQLAVSQARNEAAEAQLQAAQAQAQAAQSDLAALQDQYRQEAANVAAQRQRAEAERAQAVQRGRALVSTEIDRERAIRAINGLRMDLGQAQETARQAVARAETAERSNQRLQVQLNTLRGQAQRREAISAAASRAQLESELDQYFPPGQL